MERHLDTEIWVIMTLTLATFLVACATAPSEWRLCFAYCGLIWTGAVCVKTFFLLFETPESGVTLGGTDSDVTIARQ